MRTFCIIIFTNDSLYYSGISSLCVCMVSHGSFFVLHSFFSSFFLSFFLNDEVVLSICSREFYMIMCLSSRHIYRAYTSV